MNIVRLIRVVIQFLFIVSILVVAITYGLILVPLGVNND